mmetsp:Transcript_118425/g.342414  ORF Transcript_118425/g.342414 Transcript_118425/m.342414 type:complete len:715 (-) Transcript_118425:395-2539(-)
MPQRQPMGSGPGPGLPNDQVWGRNNSAQQRAGPRPQRGRSPQTRGRAGPPQGSGPGPATMPGPVPINNSPGEWPQLGQPPKRQEPERDWAKLRRSSPQRGSSRGRATAGGAANAGQGMGSSVSAASAAAAMTKAKEAKASKGGPEGMQTAASDGVAPMEPAASDHEKRAGSKEPWRPSRPYPLPVSPSRAGRSSLSPQRPSSVVRRTSVDRRLSAERRVSAERRKSTERRSSAERRLSNERRFNAERARLVRGSSMERMPPGGGRAKSVGPTAYRRSGSVFAERNYEREPRGGQGVQLSEFWPHKLPNGNQVQVWIVADQGQLNQAAYRLNYLQTTVAAVDFQGVNPQGGGRLSLCLVVFMDGNSMNCFVFDLLQLGESFQALTPFLQSTTVSKLIYDVPTYAKLCAQQFGISLASIFHAQSAYELLVGQQAGSLIELLEWCGVAPPQARAEATMMERAPELWGHRPLAKETIISAVHSVSFLHSAGYVLWNRITENGGQRSANMVTQASQQRVQEAVDAGWQLRNQGIQATDQRYDPELDSWLARRFKARTEDAPVLPEGVVRAGDSPRTASWRATVAQMQPGGHRSKSRGFSPGRQRSESPSLEGWIAARNQVKGTEQVSATTTAPRAHRATSLPPRSANTREHQPPSPLMTPGALETMRMGLQLEALKGDGRTWAEILEDEQATEEKDADDDLFKQLKEEDRRRLAEAELS